jgi:hypothetical protein
MTLTFNWKYFLIGLLIVAIDLAVYICLGVARMSYEDFYEGPAEHYGDWYTLSAFDKKVAVGLITWNIINVAAILFIIFRFVKQIRSNKN